MVGIILDWLLDSHALVYTLYDLFPSDVVIVGWACDYDVFHFCDGFPLDDKHKGILQNQLILSQPIWGRLS